MTSSATHQILVVDDEPIVVSLVRDALEEEDYEVFTAARADEALSIIDRQPLHLLLTDIRMPGMDGIEMVRQARTKQPDLSVIFMTGYANLNSAKDAIKQGAFDYIMKPFELSEIRQAVHNAIKAKADVAEKTQAQELSKFSDLNQMLFATNDCPSLVTSSLKFIMMHLHVAQGEAMFCDRIANSCTTVLPTGEPIQQVRPLGPLQEALQVAGTDCLKYPLLIRQVEDHPLYKANPQPELVSYLLPKWTLPGQQVIVAPIMYANSFFGWFLLGTAGQATSIKESDLKFLTVTANQLAIALENLALLEETQKAYAGLKELQDETIRLEKIAARGQMSAEIGHELNNFIGVVSGNLQLLDIQVHKGNYNDLGRYISVMSDTIGKMKLFTSNLMDLMPIATQKSIIQFDKLMAEVVEFVRPQKRFRGVKLQITLPTSELPIDADSTQLQQLLYNLLNNAADAVAESPRKEISVKVTPDPIHGQLTASVTDTGCGFPTELLEKAFQERFTTKKLGHGFGLIVCKRIIENHGGKLTVSSKPGCGTTISITFPLAVSEPVPA